MKRTDKNIELLCVEMYNQGYSFKKISEILRDKGIDINSVTVYNICKRCGVKPRNKGGKEGFTDKEIENICQLYFEKFCTLSQIAEKFNCVPNTIKNIVSKDYKYKERASVNYKNLGINHNFFSVIDTEEKAYILGFLLADGNVYKDTSYRIRLCLALQDIKILYRIKEILNLTSEVRISKRDNRENSQAECLLNWSSEQQFKDLGKYGIVPNKSLISYLPINQINSDVVHHFIRGLFDGDGCISVFQNRQALSFVGTYEVINTLKCFLCENLSLYPVKISERTKKNTVYQVLWSSKKDVLNIYNYLYKDATIFLERKYLKFQEIK